MKDPPYRKTRETYNTPGEAHELTFTCYKYRKFLSRDRTRQYFIASMQRARRKHGFHLWAYVIMPEHVHMIVYPPQDEYDVSVILKSIELSVAKKAMNYLRRHNPKGLRYLETGMAGAPHAFWMDGGGYDRNIIRRETLGFMVNLYAQQSRASGFGDPPGSVVVVECRRVGRGGVRAVAARS